MGIALILGMALKHFLPFDNFNKYIPMINAVIIGSGMQLTGLDATEAFSGGMASSFMASGLHASLKAVLPKSRLKINGRSI